MPDFLLSMKMNDIRNPSKHDDKIRCYSLRNYYISDTEKTIAAVDALKHAGYDSKIYVKNGDMLGYVFAKQRDLEVITEILKTCDIGINPKPVGRKFSEMLKKLS